MSGSPFDSLLAKAEQEAAKKTRGTPNYSQYQLAIAESSAIMHANSVMTNSGNAVAHAVAEVGPIIFQPCHDADAYRQLRHLMEREFSLPTLDDLVVPKKKWIVDME